MNKYLILGIGNIGPEFENTRHNIGFDTLDKLATELKVSFDAVKLAFRAEAKYKGCLLYTSPSPRDQRGSRMPSWA